MHNLFDLYFTEGYLVHIIRAKWSALWQFTDTPA
jgi:hypothetical protein